MPVESPCTETLPPVAGDVVRGVSRLLYRHDRIGVPEVSLGNGRRADIMAIDAKGRITIIEIKVSRADLLGDGKWFEYLDHCDYFYWAVPTGFDLIPFDREDLLPEVAGLIVSDRYDAEILRPASHRPMAGARRKSETLRFARRAAQRLLHHCDPVLLDLYPG